MGLFKRARSFHRASRAADFSGGLLRKSLHILENLFPPSSDPRESVGQTKPAASPADKLEELLSGLNELEDGIEAPGRFFALAKEHLELRRAALLLYDPVRMIFAPWAAHGFDETTNHHLRIPLGANETMNRLAAGKVIVASGPDTLKQFQQFFSFREFSTLENLLLIPFIHENKFMGMLLIAEMESDFSQCDLSGFETLAVRAAGLFYQARERRLEAAKRGIPVKPESLRESVRAAVQACLASGAPPIMIGINTADIIEKVKKRNPYIDPFHLREDIARVVLSLFQSLGPVFQIDQERILILVNLTPERDPELLLYHLKATMSRLLPELADQGEIDLEERVRMPGANVEEVLTFLAEIV